ncbi:hypothetical protein A3844_28620 [Paenibacillus helianthi]|uniref:[acyl-carrier-protein] S-malonyltransferase n=1 Tax=Paenibacillus helianthi TaxID=1349432 RepID=A0ABX3EF60_9BACL|nr:ACP S-malonyltransferase [Paenibacillus helianthi]OKP79494.1 hypothetical protein A3844_28620 [Paenibacillus helianthi]
MDNLALLFPGQGSQYVGMGRIFYNRYAIARETFEQAEDTLGYSLKEMCFSGNMEQLSMTEFAQPAILTVSMAAFRVFQQEFNIQPALAAGHSLGEITALTCSGTIRYADALQIVRSRGQLMQQAVSEKEGAMSAVIGLKAEVIEQLCKEYSLDERVVVIANYNAAHQIVISGHAEEVRKVGETCLELGATSVVGLQVSAPFHSPLMQPAVSRMREVLGQFQYHDPKWPVLSSTTGRLYEATDDIVEKLASQLILPVNWQAVMDYVAVHAVSAIEIGPRNVLKNLARSAPFQVFGFEKLEDILGFRQGIEDEKERMQSSVTQLVDRALAIIVCTKNRNPQADEYEHGVLGPYAELLALRASLESGKVQATATEVDIAYSLLMSMMIAKQAPMEEQVIRYNQLFQETGHRNLVSEKVLTNA